jgi:tRNA-splicing ligase RtcB (3'-phosphate/5'-hydroxy nucleic acid ligase)
MAEPILVSRGLDNPQGLGFAPHGAGRNLSRTAYLKKIGQRPHAQVVAEETKGLDVRWFCGAPDVSELPMAYKNAASLRQQIAQFQLCTIVDVIVPLGSIMAGDWQANAPWRKKVA